MFRSGVDVDGLIDVRLVNDLVRLAFLSEIQFLMLLRSFLRVLMRALLGSSENGMMLLLLILVHSLRMYQISRSMIMMMIVKMVALVKKGKERRGCHVSA